MLNILQCIVQNPHRLKIDRIHQASVNGHNTKHKNFNLTIIYNMLYKIYNMDYANIRRTMLYVLYTFVYAHYAVCTMDYAMYYALCHMLYELYTSAIF